MTDLLFVGIACFNSLCHPAYQGEWISSSELARIICCEYCIPQQHVSKLQASMVVTGLNRRFPKAHLGGYSEACDDPSKNFKVFRENWRPTGEDGKPSKSVYGFYLTAVGQEGIYHPDTGGTVWYERLKVTEAAELCRQCNISKSDADTFLQKLLSHTDQKIAKKNKRQEDTSLKQPANKCAKRCKKAQQKQTPTTQPDPNQNLANATVLAQHEVTPLIQSETHQTGEARTPPLEPGQSSSSTLQPDPNQNLINATVPAQPKVTPLFQSETHQMGGARPSQPQSAQSSSLTMQPANPTDSGPHQLLSPALQAAVMLRPRHRMKVLQKKLAGEGPK